MTTYNSKPDENSRGTLIALSSAGDGSIVQCWADPTTHRLLVDSASGTGTVTKVSVVTANGISGTVATDTTTPAITLVLGDITPSKVNGNTITAGTGTITITGTKTLTVSDTATVSGTNTGDNVAASTSAAGLAPQATAPAAGLYNYLGITNGETAYTNKALFNATSPSTQDFGDSAVVGTSANAARQDHKHAMMAAPTSVSGNAGTVTVAAETGDTSCSVALVTDVSGSLPIKTNTNLTFNASTGVLTSASAVLTTVDINGGTFDNATIGASTPSTIIGTTVQANTGFVPDANDGAYLGTTALGFSDLFLATGGVVNWANGNATLTHSTGLLTSNVPVSLGTSNAFTCGTVELGAASDCTIARVGAGQISVESVAIPTISSTNTLTNKRITKRVTTTTDDATAVIDIDTCDEYELSAVANATEFTLTGTPTDGQTLVVRIKDAGVAKGLTWTGFIAIGVTLPTTTTAGKWTYVGCKYNLAATAWHAIAVTTQV